MSIDEQVLTRLQELTDGLKPIPDPYDRVRKRFERSQRRRKTVVALGVAGLLAGGGAVVWPREASPPPAANQDSEWKTMLAWAENLPTARQWAR